MSQETHEIRTVLIRNREGMHARPAAAFVKLAGQYRSHVRVAKEALEVDGKSIMGVMMLAAEQGSELRVMAAGEDAALAVEALVGLVENGFGEA